jgi:integrase
MRQKKPNRRRRLPNGFGQISEIKNRNLRRPFRAMVSAGKDRRTGRPICKPLQPESYFATYNEAYAALTEYNRNPYDLSPTLTVRELYERWLADYEKKVSGKSSISSIRSAWSYCSALYEMRVTDVRARHIKGVMEHGRAVVRGVEKTITPYLKIRVKSLFNVLLDYAVEYELVERNFARTFAVSSDVSKEVETNRREHISFTDDEMDLLWENLDRIPYIDVLLVQCYAGWRPQELGLIRIEDVDLDNWTFTGGMKTEAGTGRLVPIHSRIRQLVQRRYDEALSLGSEYLFNSVGKRTRGLKLTYGKYKNRFRSIVEELGLNPRHQPHDGRVQFVTMAKKYGVDEYAIKYIVGHAIPDITEKVYTRRENSWLSEEIEKIE